MNDNLGRSLTERVSYLAQSLTEEDKSRYPKIENFIKIWGLTTGGSFDFNEHTDFFIQTNRYALGQLDKLFKEKFGSSIDPIKK